jgi:pyrroloquinoline quinone biosynthesis protein D
LAAIPEGNLKNKPNKMTLLDESSRPMLSRGVRLWNDPIKGEPILLFPEGVLPLDDAAFDILRRCTGEKSMVSIIESLSEEYETDYDTLCRDVCEYFLGLREQMLVTFAK